MKRKLWEDVIRPPLYRFYKRLQARAEHSVLFKIVLVSLYTPYIILRRTQIYVFKTFVACRKNLTNGLLKLWEDVLALPQTLLSLLGRGFRLGIRLLNFCIFGGMLGIHLLKKALGLQPRQVESILEVSALSHKPKMLSLLFREKGFRSQYFALNTNWACSWISQGYDYGLPNNLPPVRRALLETYYVWFVAARYDVIHYHFSALLTSTGWEVPILKRLGKVIVFHYRGCDARQKSLNLAKNPELNCCMECDYPAGSCENGYQRWRLEFGRKYGDLMLVTTPDLLDFVPEGQHIPFIPPLGVDLEAVTPVTRDRGVFRVVTSSNHHGVDGTQYVRDAVARLQAEGESIELVEVVKVPYREALSIYKSADVYVGKLLMGYYNNANIECMLMGVPCMTYIRPQFLEPLGDCPIINTRPKEVYDNLKRYLGDREALRELGARGPEFIRRHHDPDVLVGRMIALFNKALAEK